MNIRHLIYRAAINSYYLPSQLLKHIFYSSAQGAILVLAFSMLIAGNLVFNSNFWLGLANFILGAGSSILAAGLILKLGSPGDECGTKSKFGISYFGDADQFHWEEWIQLTPSRCEILIVGTKNNKWIEKRIVALTQAKKRHVDIKFIFVGTADEIGRNVVAFEEMLRRYERDGHGLSIAIRKKELLSDDILDFGFYWNGRSLIVKLNLPGVERANAPIICFDTSFACPFFSKEEFGLTQLPIMKPDALLKAVRALDAVIVSSKEYAGNTA